MQLDVSHGLLSLTSSAGEMLLQAHAEIRLAGGRILTTINPPSPQNHTTIAPIPHWSSSLLPDRKSLRIDLAVTNTTDQPIQVEQLLPLISDSGFKTIPVEQLRVAEMGWESWSQPHPLRPFAPNMQTVDLPVRAPILPARLPDSEASAWMAILARDGDEAFMAGFVKATDLTGVIEIAPAERGHRLLAWCDAEGWILQPGETLACEPLLLALGTQEQLLDRYAAAVAEEMPPRRWRGGPGRVAQDQLVAGAAAQGHTSEGRPAVPTGWCSWYHFYTRVSEADLDRNLAVLAQLKQRLPIEVFQLDDGYQTAVGDWLSLNDKFPSGMPALTARIRAAGFTPGVWLAPFLLSANSRTYGDHPDWVVHDEAGQPMDVMDNWGSANYALDTTHPEALAYVDHVVRTMCQDWGYDYLKIDFIYAAAVRGRRHDPAVTGVQAYRRGVELIRRVAGERFILGCGAPFVPSVGLVDGMRIGEDVAPFWRQPGNAPGPAMVNALHSTLLHNWMHGRWWVNDPDCVIVREHDSQLTLAEVQAWAGVVALSGGMLLLSDDLSTNEPERMALLERLFPPLGEPSLALPPYEHDLPQRLLLEVKRPWGSWRLLGVANWSDEPRQVQIAQPFDAPYHVVDLWTGAHLGPLTGPLQPRTLEPHEMLLLSLHPALDRPHVVGSTGHVLGEAMDVLDERWDGATLTIALAGPRPHRGELLVYVPEGFAHENGRRLVRVPFDLSRAGQTVELRLSPDL